MVRRIIAATERHRRREAALVENVLLTAWLNIDAVVPAELRERMPAGAAAAHKVLDALLESPTSAANT